MGCRPVAVVIMHVHKYEIRINALRKTGQHLHFSMKNQSKSLNAFTSEHIYS